MEQLWPPVPWRDRLARCVSCHPEDFAPERLKPYGVRGAERQQSMYIDPRNGFSMPTIDPLNGVSCAGCMAGPSMNFPTKIYGRPFDGLGAFDPGPLKTAMVVIGVLIVGGLAASYAFGSKKKTTRR